MASALLLIEQKLCQVLIKWKLITLMELNCLYWWLNDPFGPLTLIEFAKFGVETVSMSKTCNFDSNISDFNSVDLKKAKKWSKAKKNFKGQIWSPKAKIFKFYDFFTNLGYFAVNYSGKVIGLSKKAIKAAKRP